MSTRSTTHFRYGDKTVAIIYRHSDGMPSGAGVDLRKFLNRCKALPDPRLDDPSYLAAKYVVFLAEMFAVDYGFDEDRTEYKATPKAERLDFLSVGVMSQDPGDIEYRYVVNCNKINNRGLPDLKCYWVNDADDLGKLVRIPAIAKSA